MLLDRFDELPMRQAGQIRGNPAGLLARLLERIDALKVGADPAEPELARLCAAHDRILAEGGAIDRGDLFLILNRLLDVRPDVREAIAARFPQVMVDEYEESTAAQKAILSYSRRGRPGLRRFFRGWRRGRFHRPESGLPQTRGAVLALHQRARPGAGGGPRRRAPAGDRHLSGRDLRAGRGPGRQGRAGGGGDGGARHPAPPLGAGGALPAARGPRRDRLAAGARRPRRLGRRRAGTDPAAGRAALRRPGAADDDRPPPQARHGLRLRGGAGEPPDPTRGARADPVLPEALRRSLDGDGGAPRRRLRAAADRAGRPAPPAPLRRAARGRRAPARALAARRSGDRLGPARAARLDPRLRPLPERRRRGGRRAGRRRGAPLPRLRDRPRPGGREGAGVRPRLRARPRGRQQRRAHRAPRPGRDRALPRRARRRLRGAPLALLRAGAGRDRGGRGGARRGALRARRRAARDLPQAARGGAGGVVEGGPRALRAAARHRGRRQPGDRPLPGAAEARRPRPAPRRRGDGGGDRSGERAAAPGGHRRAADRARRLGAGLLPARLRARPRQPPAPDLGPPRALAGGLPAAARRRRPQPLGLGPRPLPHLPAEVQVRPRLRHSPGADDQPALRDPHPQRARTLPQGRAGARAKTASGA